jgi:hypothetical protein
MSKGVMVAAFVGLAALAGCASVQVVRIGHAAPLTGPLANLGTDNPRGAQLAIDDLNAKSPRINGQPVRFELVSATIVKAGGPRAPAMQQGGTLWGLPPALQPIAVLPGSRERIA